MQESTYITHSPVSLLLRKISFWILLAVTFLIPLFFLPVSFISIQFGTSLLFAFGVIAAFLLYIVSSFLSGSIDVPKPTWYVLGALFSVPVVYVIAGLVNGFSRMVFLGYTFDESTVGFIVLSFVCLFLVSVLFTQKNRIFYSYVAFVLSSLVFALFLIVRLVFGASALSFGMFNTFTTTMLGNWNNVAIFFGISVILSLITHQMVRTSKPVTSVISLALIVSLFFLALVNFAAVWIIVAVCALLLIVYSLYVKKHEGPFKVTLSAIPLYPSLVLIIALVFTIWGSSLGGFLANKMNVSNIEVRPSLSVTALIAENSLRAHPLFGSGPNMFVTEWLSHKPADVIGTVFWNTDFAYGIGILPTFAVTTGLFGILSWLFFFGLFIHMGIKSIFTKNEDPFLTYLSVSSFFVSLYLWVVACVYVSSSALFILTFFFTGIFFASLYLSGTLSLSTYFFAQKQKVGFVSSVLLVAFFVGSTALGYGLFKNSKSLWYFQKSSYALNISGDVAASETFIQKAIAAVPYDVYYRASSEIEMYKLQQILAQDPKTITQTEVEKQLTPVVSSVVDAGLHARDADPANYLNWVALGSVYESLVPLKIQGAYESAQLSYSEALRRNPMNPGIALLFSRLEIARGDLNQAKVFALQAIQMKQNYLDAYFLLSQIEVSNKNLKGAIESVTAASVLSPTDAGVFFQLGLLKYNGQDFTGAIAAFEHSLTLAPDYANAKYFLGLSYEATGQHAKAIALFTDLQQTNPDNKDVSSILTNLRAGKSIFESSAAKDATKGSKLPVPEKQ